MADAKHLVINPGFQLGGAATAGNFNLDQTTDALEFILQAERALTITKIGFRYGLRTGTPPTYKLSIQGTDATTGNPDGTIKGGGTPASVTFTPPADTSWDGTWRELTLDNPYTTTRGEEIAIVIKYDSGTVDASNFSSLTQTDGNSYYASIEGKPYSTANNAGTRTKSGSRPVFTYVTASEVFGFPNLSGFTSAAFTTGTNPNEIATTFTLPAGWGSTFQLHAVRLRTNVPATGKSGLVRLYSGTTVLQTYTFDSDIVQAQNNRVFLCEFTDTTLATLNFGQQYRVSFTPQDAVGNWTFSGLNVNSNADLGALPLGVDWYYSTRNGGAWTDITATRLNWDLHIADIVSQGIGRPAMVVSGQNLPVY